MVHLEAPTPLLATLRLLVPTLTAERYKGQAGKVAVVGGCADYTGAPYYAAASALKLGVRLCPCVVLRLPFMPHDRSLSVTPSAPQADLSHVFCSDAATTVRLDLI